MNDFYDNLGVNGRDEYGGTALMRAAESGDAHRVKALIAAGADVNARIHKHTDRTTPLMCAARGTNYRNVESISALIAAGADVNAMDNDGNTALMYASNFGDPESVKALIVAGAKVDARRDTGSETALMKAVNNPGASLLDRRLNCIAVLLAAGADVNARTLHGITPLMFAVCSNDAASVKSLLVAGANVNAQTLRGKTALMFAAEKGDIFISADTPFARANADCARLLLDAGADASLKDKDGKTARDFAIINKAVLPILLAGSQEI